MHHKVNINGKKPKLSPSEENPESERWLAYLDSLSWRKGELDECSWYGALRAASLGIEPQAAHDEIASRVKGGGGLRLDKIAGQLTRAYGQELELDSLDGSRPKPRVEPFEPEKLLKFALQLKSYHGKEWLRGHSPQAVDIGPEAFLEALYREGESIVILDRQKSQGGLWKRGERLSRFVSGCDGVWFLVQPVDGKFHFNPRTGRQSQRSEESVTSWRYAVLECDHEPKEIFKPLWLQLLVQMPLDIVALIDSGGKSVAAIVRIDAGSKDEWDNLGAEFKQIFVPLGADPAALTAVRLTRLPGCMRGTTNRPQELLWFNPEADEEKTILEYVK
jgi:hypothetical protein